MSLGHVIALHLNLLSTVRQQLLQALTAQHSQNKPTRGSISLPQDVHCNKRINLKYLNKNVSVTAKGRCEHKIKISQVNLGIHIKLDRFDQ